MTNEPVLKTLFWETTLRCNAHCVFCGSSCGDCQQSPDELTTEEIRHALEDVAAKLPAEEILLNITGGEPLLREDVFDVAEYAVALGFSWGMVTNGSLITPAVIGRMKQAGMKTLTVSLDGCRETHERLRCLPGSFDRILTSLKSIREEGFTEHLQVTTVVNRQNIGELEALRELLLPVGLDSWRVVMVDPIGRACDNREVLLSKEQVRQYFDFCLRYRDDPRLPVLESCSHFFGPWETQLRQRCFECGTGRRVASILWNGDIFVCPNVERRPELIQGNVRQDSLGDCWKNGFAWFRSPERTLGENCRKCYYRERCGGDSLHTFDFVRQFPRFCIRELLNEEQTASLLAKEAVFRQEIRSLREKGGSMTAQRFFSDRPAGSRVVLTPEAVKELQDYFVWGMETSENMIEQLAALLGEQCEDLLMIRHVVPVPMENAGRSTGNFTSVALAAAEYALFRLRKTEPDTRLLGFVHSHPEEVETILSEGDEALHRRLLLEQGLPLSMLVNPQKKRCRAYYGQDFELSEVYFLGTDQNNG